MPEADSVERTATVLNTLSGQVLTGCDLRWPSLATVDLTGRLLMRTVRYGKHLLTRFAADGDRPAVTLHSHLRMDGSWRVVPAGGAPPRRHTVRAVLTAGDRVAVGDRLGMLDLVRTSAEHTLVGHLGPDILDPALDVDAVTASIRGVTHPVGQALLDQRVVAGLGTLWVSEGLWAAGIHPWHPGADVDPAAAGTALGVLAAQIAASVAGGRSRPRVYGLRRHPCPRCATPIRRDPIGHPPQQRDLFWCPTCQPAPRAGWARSVTG